MQAKQLDLQQLSNILSEATITITQDHAGMLIHTINHPTIGTAITIQADAGALLIKSL